MWLSIPLFTSVVLLVLYLGVYKPYHNFEIEKTEAEQVKTQFQETFAGLEQGGPLTALQRNRVVQAANHEKCTCGCGYTLAACLKTDQQCPIREKNLAMVKEMIRSELSARKPIDK